MKLSVVIATYNRKSKVVTVLEKLFHSARAAHLAKDEFEILVVDNASTDDTFAALTMVKNQHSEFILHVIHETKKGTAHARNAGLKVARGEILAILDDDCNVDETYVAEIIRLFSADAEPVLRGGRVLLGDPLDLPVSIQESVKPLRWKKGVINDHHLGAGVVPGANMIFPRKILETIGLYDPLFGVGAAGIPAGEDSDYIYRAFAAGFAIEYCPSIIVRHFHGRRNMADVKKISRVYCIGTGALLAKYNVKHPNVIRKFAKFLPGQDKKSAHAHQLQQSPAAETSPNQEPSKSNRQKIKYRLPLIKRFYFLAQGFLLYLVSSRTKSQA